MKNYSTFKSTTRREAPPASKAKRPNLTLWAMCAITIVWALVVGGLIALQEHHNRAGEITTEVEQGSESTSIAINFTDENGLGHEENREVIALAAEVVRLIEERGFRVEQVIVPRGYLREFNLVMNREETGDTATDYPTLSIRLRCSTTRLASATAADAIYIFDRWLDGEIAATSYIDIRVPRRAFYQ